jgi:hypothetical protein
MLVVSPARLSESAGLLKDRIAYPIFGKAFALSKSLGPLLYLVWFGVIAVWVVGVFFGVGFFFLTHRSEKQAIQLGVGGAHLVTLFPESPGVYQSISGSDRFLAQPSETATPEKKETAATADIKGAALNGRQQIVPAEPAADGNAEELEPLDALGLRSTTQSLLPTSPHKPHQARSANSRTPQPHPPVQAIQDLLQMHSELLK